MIHGIRSLAIVTVALAGTTAGAVASGLGAADAAPATHTLRLAATQIKDVIVHGVDVATDVDRQHGKASGYDVTSCRVNVNSHVASCQVAVARAGGIIFGHAKVNVATGAGHGAITGGSGRFRGVRGSITVRGTGPTTTKIKLMYHS